MNHTSHEDLLSHAINKLQTISEEIVDTCRAVGSFKQVVVLKFCCFAQSAFNIVVKFRMNCMYRFSKQCSCSDDVEFVKGKLMQFRPPALGKEKMS